MWFLAVALALCQPAAFAAVPKVGIRLYGESGCPYTERFILGPLNALAHIEPLADILDFDLIPFGNACYVTPETLCGGGNRMDSYRWGSSRGFYRVDVRKCFNRECGLGGPQPDSCYQHGPYCQHGAAECALNEAQACARESFSGFKDFVTMVACIQTSFRSVATSGKDSVVPALRACAAKLNAEPGPLLACVSDRERVVQQSVRMAQATPPHPGVPYLEITNKTGVPFVLDVPDDHIPSDLLTGVVCSAWAYNGGSPVVACDTQAHLLP